MAATLGLLKCRRVGSPPPQLPPVSSQLPPAASLVQLASTGSGSHAGASRSQLRTRSCYSFKDRGLVAKVFGPPIFDASKLDVMFMGVSEDAEHPFDLPRIYTLTHSDITAMLTLTISKSINKAQLQGWYKRLQRDDVVAMWRRSQGSMSLHVHCHISGGHWFRDALARLRFHIFKRELPVVLEAFRHGDQALLIKHPDLEKAPVWVYFHSNVKEFNKVECWGALQFAGEGITEEFCKHPVQCRIPCNCCFPR